jgi:hypothetical protein
MRDYDFDDIQRRREAGEQWASIAASYGRSKQAVEQVTRRHFAPKPTRLQKVAAKVAKVAMEEARREVAGEAKP